MSGVRIHFHAMPGCPHILQSPAHCATILTTGDHPDPLKIIGVFRNGGPLKFRALDDNTVAVSPPIPFEGDRIELHCLSAKEPHKPIQALTSTYPSPGMEYGLQRRSEPAAGGSR